MIQMTKSNFQFSCINIFWICIILIFASCNSTSSDTNNINSKTKAGLTQKVEKPEPFKYPTYLNQSFLQGYFKPANHPDFVLIPDSLRSGRRMYLQKDVLKAFDKMRNAIAQEGLNIYVISACRTFEAQKRIWRRKWQGHIKLGGTIDASKEFKDPVERAIKILEYSSMPGTSRHHWGTDLDINELNNAYFENGKGKQIYEWMEKYASDFGFCQPYTKIDSLRPYGYQEEKWHWTYMPISRILTKAYKDSIGTHDIRGFLGDAHVKDLDIITKYVLGLNDECNM